MNLMRGIDLAKIAEKLPGASGAEIKAVCTEAGMYALRERRVHVTQEDFEMAVAKVCMFYLDFWCQIFATSNFISHGCKYSVSVSIIYFDVGLF
jgi:hypothetical protein